MATTDAAAAAAVRAAVVAAAVIVAIVKNEWFCSSTSQCTNPPVIGNYRMAIWRGNVAIVDEHSLAWRLAVSGSRTFRIDEEPLGSVLQGQDY